MHSIAALRQSSRLLPVLSLAAVVFFSITPALSRAEAAPPEPAAMPVEARLAAAWRDYEDNRWQRAFDQFAELADGGHPEAARVAWQMWRNGPALFNQDFAASASRRTHWLGVWQCAAAPMAHGCASIVARLGR